MSNHLSYAHYAPWINGAQGALFWNLSQTKETAYSIAKQVSHEAFLASKYLLQPTPVPDIPVRITSTGGDNTVQILVREDPDFVPDAIFKNKVMVMFCNNHDQAASITIHFPDPMQFAGKLDPNYSPDTVQLLVNNIFKIEMAAYTARAYIFKLKY